MNCDQRFMKPLNSSPLLHTIYENNHTGFGKTITRHHKAQTDRVWQVLGSGSPDQFPAVSCGLTHKDRWSHDQPLGQCGLLLLHPPMDGVEQLRPSFLP